MTENPDSFTVRERSNNVQEAKKIIYIKDIPPKDVGWITKNNILEVVDTGVQALVYERESYNDMTVPETASALEIIALTEQRASYTHAIQCAVNTIVDYKDSLAVVTQQDKGPSSQRQEIVDFFERGIEMNKQLEQLYRRDIVLRIGHQKEDRSFQDIALPIPDRLVDEMKNSLQIFQHSNPELLESTVNEIQRLQKHLDDPSTITADSYYDEVCMVYSKIAQSDFDIYNKDKLFKAARAIG